MSSVSDRIHAGSGTALVLTVQAGDGSGLPLSAAQEALWLADSALPDNAQYNLGRVVHLDGPLDVSALRAALIDIVARHEALRTSVSDAGDEVRLRVGALAAADAELAVIDVPADQADAAAVAVASRPFKLAAGWLWRAELHRLAPGQHRLVLVMHHLISDLSTFAVLLADLGFAYRSRIAGDHPELPPARPFSEYLAWESDFLASPDCAAQIAYWTEQVSGVPPVELPADRLRQPGSRRPGATLPLTVAAGTADALRAVARGNGATLAHVMLACYATMVHRYAGQDDLIIGMPVSVRRAGRWAGSAGLFVNTMPIRITLAGNPAFASLLSQVRGTVFGAIGAAEAPIVAIAADARARGSARAGPLFDVTFGLAPGSRLRIDLPGVTSRVTGLYGGQAKFDLHLEVADDGPGAPLSCQFEYDTDLFDEATVRRFAASVTAIAQAVAAAPGQSVGNLPLWQDAPGAAAGGAAPGGAASGLAGRGVDAGAALAPLAADGRVDTLFAEIVAAAPDKIGLVDAGNGTEFSYADLAARSLAVAGLLAEHGIGRGDFVGITLPRSTDLVIAILGVLTAGAAYVPLDGSYPVPRLREMIGCASIAIIIGEAPAGLDVPVLSLPSGPGQRAAGRLPADRAGAGTGEDPAYVMFTSGSTGVPKAVVIPHRAVVRLVRGTRSAAMTSGERWLHSASPSFDASTLELWAPLLNGGTLVVLPGRLTVADIGEAIRRYQVTSAFLTTGLFNLVVDSDAGVLRPLRHLVFGGEAASATHMRRALEVVPTVVNGYGPTENTTFTSCYVATDPARVTAPVPIGTPVPGTTVHIVDAYFSPMPPGAVGEIVAGGHGVAIGYAGAPALTAERFVPNPFGPPGSRLYRTGDYGKFGPDGTLHFAGRVDDQVKVRGYRIELGAIEHALLGHPGVSQAAVTVHADPSGDRRLVGYTVGPARPDDLTDHMRGLLPGYMVPGQWITVDALPLGPTGKVDRAALPAPAAAAVPARHPPTLAEDLIIGWYTELLGLGEASPDTDFFLVGGHSLFAARLVSRIKATFGVEFSLSVIFDNPRIGSLASLIAQSAAASGRPLSSTNQATST